jgi:hypothetical protein
MAVLVGTLLGAALLVVTLPVARRAGRLDGDPATARLVRWGLVLKLLAAPIYLAVIGSVYGGGDYSLYSQHAAAVAHVWRNFRFSAPVPVLTGFSTQDNFVSYVAGGVYTVTGVTVLGATLFFSWLAFWGQYLCYRAFRTAVPNGARVRYGRLVFLFPSMLFWTAPIGKDARPVADHGRAAEHRADGLRRARACLLGRPSPRASGRTDGVEGPGRRRPRRDLEPPRASR